MRDAPTVKVLNGKERLFHVGTVNDSMIERFGSVMDTMNWSRVTVEPALFKASRRLLPSSIGCLYKFGEIGNSINDRVSVKFMAFASNSNRPWTNHVNGNFIEGSKMSFARRQVTIARAR